MRHKKLNTPRLIIKKIREVWKIKSYPGLSLSYLRKEEKGLFGAITKPSSPLLQIPELKHSTPAQRYLWVVKKLGLKARKIQIKLPGIRYPKWEVY